MLFLHSYSKSIIACAASALALSACASTPPAKNLLNGISQADLNAKPTSVDVNGLRSASDPVCVQFYQNSVEFAQASGKPNVFGQILTATGVSVLASVATNGLLGGGSNSVGDIAARSATSQLIFTGSSAALTGLNASRGPDKKIIAKAETLKCPVGIG
ncbi:MAG: hypothetical protein ABJG88_04170 [Litorimonas sp.]